MIGQRDPALVRIESGHDYKRKRIYNHAKKKTDRRAWLLAILAIALIASAMTQAGCTRAKASDPAKPMNWDGESDPIIIGGEEDGEKECNYPTTITTYVTLAILGVAIGVAIGNRIKRDEKALSFIKDSKQIDM